MRLTATIFISALLALTFSLSTWAQSTKYTGSVLWKISGKDITKPSYILGTHHLVDISFLKEIKGFDNAIANTNVAIGEIDMSNKDAIAQLMQTEMLLPEGENPYKEFLSAESYAKLSQELVNYVGAPLESFTVLKPAAISMILAVQLHNKVFPKENPQNFVGIDEHIQNLARANNKKVIGLETAKEQMNIIFESTIQEQLKELECFALEIEKGIDAVKKMNVFYKKFDLLALYNLAIDADKKSACPWSAETKQNLLDTRNNNWLKQLPQLMKENASFIAVGALHLAGKEGLLYQLEKMGYTVEAVK